MEIKILGRASKKVELLYEKIWGLKKTTNKISLFCDYSEFDIPRYFSFSYLKTSDRIFTFSKPIILEDISQEFHLVFDEIPKGHKTICNFKTAGKEDEYLFKSLEVMETWIQPRNASYLIA